MTSKEIKTKLLHFYRFKKRYKFIATEAGKWNSDVLVSNEKEILEIEVKVSLADLKKDFKKRKHGIYKNPTPYYTSFLPNKFYFCVPPELEEEATVLLKGSIYGLLICSTEEISFNGKFIKCLQNATPLRKGISKKLLHALILRMGSELVGTRIKDLGEPEELC